MPTTTTTRVLLVDANPVFRRGLRVRLDHTDDLTVVGELPNVADAETTARAEHANVVVLELRAPTEPTLAAVRALTKPDDEPPLPAVRVLVLSHESGVELVLAAFDAGAAGYLLRSLDTAVVPDAIRTAARGDTFLSSHVTADVLADLACHLRDEARAYQAAASVLTPGEIAVVAQLCRGPSSANDIATAVSLPVETVRSLLSSAMHHTGTSDHVQLALWGLRRGADRIIRTPREPLGS